MHTCSTCGKVWEENYCPECARTIDRGQPPPPPLPGGPVNPPVSQERRALDLLSRAVPPVRHTPPVVQPVRPRIVTLYRIWCGLILIVYVAFGIREGLIVAGALPPRLGPITQVLSSGDPALRAQMLAEERENSFIGLGMASTGLVLFGTGMLYCPRASWAWVWGIVAIVVSVFPLCVSIAGAVPLLIFWLKPETKQYFGWN